MPDYRIVLRPISTAEGQTLQSGTVVDVSGWRNLKTLENMGRIDTESIPAPAKKQITRSKTASTTEKVSDNVHL